MYTRLNAYFETAINAINAEERQQWRNGGEKGLKILKRIRKSAWQRTENYSRDNIAGTMAFDARTIPKISKAGRTGSVAVRTQ